MKWEQWAVISGVSSMLLFQIEQELRFWIEKHKSGRPYYDGNWLPLLARMEKKLRAWNKTYENVVIYIPWARWIAVLTGVMSLMMGGLDS